MIIADSLPRSSAIGNLLPSDRLLWVVLAIIAVAVPPWAHLLSVKITGLPQALAVVAAIFALRAAYVMVRPGAQVVHRLLENAAGVIAYTAIVAPVSYLCARNSRPLFDGALQAADRAIGYDWQVWATAEHEIPAVALVLQLAYASLLPQTVLLLAMLPLIGDGRRGYGLIRASLIAVIIACAGSYAFPAAGPNALSTDWYPHWAALRTAEPFTTSLQQVQGIIAFPSFHASLAVLLFYSVRGLGVVTWVFGLLEAVMLVSTPTYGHHYLCDVMAGIVVAVLALLLSNQLDRSFPLTRLRIAMPGIAHRDWTD